MNDLHCLRMKFEAKAFLPRKNYEFIIGREMAENVQEKRPVKADSLIHEIEVLRRRSMWKSKEKERISIRVKDLTTYGARESEFK